jgi:NitT/TauT family transport system substrate-binding protein
MGKSGKHLLLFPMLAILLAISGCNSGNYSSGGQQASDDVSKDNPSGDLAPLKETAKVVIAEDGSASGAGFYIAKELGYFDDYNIEVEFATFGNSDDMLPALASGEVDIAGGISSASFFNSIAQGIDVKMIADKGHNVTGKSYFSFVIDKKLEGEITEYSDFKGRTIAVSTKNAVDDYIYQQMIKHAGLTEDDVQFELMSDFGNMLSAIGSGAIDAALQIEPLITQGVEEDIYVRFGDTTDYAPNAQIAMVLASPKFLTDREDVALRFMTAYLKGVRDYNDAFVKGTGDLNQIIEIMTKHTPMKDTELWKKVSVTGLNPNGEMFIDDIKNQYDVYKENDAIKGEVDFNDAIDTSITEKAVKIIGEYE